MDSDDNDDNSEDIGRDFAKLSRIAHNNGYREGIQEETDHIYQSCFDSGFSRGFQTGLALGLYKGILSSVDKKLAFIDTSKKKHCQICQDEKLAQAPSDIIEAKQVESNEELVKRLEKNYSSVLDQVKIDKKLVKDYILNVQLEKK